MLRRIVINFRAVVAIMVLFFMSAKAQNSYKVPHNTLSFALGSASYYGDLSSTVVQSNRHLMKFVGM
jgi:hypothetical protein